MAAGLVATDRASELRDSVKLFGDHEHVITSAIETDLTSLGKRRKQGGPSPLRHGLSFSKPRPMFFASPLTVLGAVWSRDEHSVF
jgi:hypothetical protein